MVSKALRDVAWEDIDGALVREPAQEQVKNHTRLGRLLMSAQALPLGGSVQDLVLASLALLRSELSIERAALFLRSRSGRWMQGTVGTNIQGELTDERGIRYPWGNCDIETHADFYEGRQAWTFLSDAPLVYHDEHASHVATRGWLVKTPVRSHDTPLGILHNDAAISGKAFSPETQEMVAWFLQILGPHLARAMNRSAPELRPETSAIVQKVVLLLAEDPSLSHEDLSSRVNLSPARLSRRFGKEMGKPLVDYRNSVRLERFFKLVDEEEEAGKSASLLQTALSSGFGSYAQFHRVFTQAFGRSPRQYLSP